MNAEFDSLLNRTALRLSVTVALASLVVSGASAKEATARDASEAEKVVSTESPGTRAHLLNQKLRLVDAMLERARQRYGDNASANSQLEIAGTLANVARGDLESGDYESAEASLNEALRLLSELSRSAHVISEEQLKARYEELIEGVETMRAAFAEVVTEKGDEARSALDIADNDRMIEEAKGQAQSGRYEKAAELLETAYERTAIALAKVRAKETLEYRLVFEGPADEYRYERDRYRSSEILVQLMIAERKPGPEALTQVDKHVNKALALDAEASRHASAGDYAAAIEKQAAASRELTHALRRIGLFVP